MPTAVQTIVKAYNLPYSTERYLTRFFLTRYAKTFKLHKDGSVSIGDTHFPVGKENKLQSFLHKLFCYHSASHEIFMAHREIDKIVEKLKEMYGTMHSAYQLGKFQYFLQTFKANITTLEGASATLHATSGMKYFITDELNKKEKELKDECDDGDYMDC